MEKDVKTLASGVAATAITYGFLYLYNSPPPLQYDFVDRFMLGGIAFVFAYASIIMVLSRRSWTPRAVGLFLSSLGIAVSFGVGWYTGRVGYQNMDLGQREAAIDFGRACLFIGGILLFLGLTDYAVRRWLSRYVDHDDAGVVIERREPGVVGRRADDISAYQLMNRKET